MDGRQSRLANLVGSKLGIGAIIVLGAVCIGAGAANYAVSDINPIYYRSVDTSRTMAIVDRSSDPQPIATSEPYYAGQYYYRPAATPAVYGEYPKYPAGRAVSDDSRDAVDSDSTPIETDAPQDVALADTADEAQRPTEDGPYMAERLPPTPRPAD